ncbi:MAG: hypothetical protein ACM3SW_12675 [Actinomycetota bacterium]
MKKLELIVVLMFALLFVVPGAWGSNNGKGHENDGISAAEMSGIGLAVASFLVAGVYLIRRQSSNRR